MKDQKTSGEVATPKFKMAAIVLLTLALLLSSCEQPPAPKVVDSREGCLLLNDVGLTILDIHADRTVTLISDKGVTLHQYSILNKPFILEGIGRKGDPVIIGARYVDNVYENGEVDRDFVKVAVASRNEEGWQKYFADKEEEKPLEKNK